MSIIERYHKIFDKEILQKSRGVIFSFSPLQDQFIYQPYSHDISVDSVEKLGKLMRHNLFFYSYHVCEDIMKPESKVCWERH